MTIYLSARLLVWPEAAPIVQTVSEQFHLSDNQIFVNTQSPTEQFAGKPGRTAYTGVSE